MQDRKVKYLNRGKTLLIRPVLRLKTQTSRTNVTHTTRITVEKINSMLLMIRSECIKPDLKIIIIKFETINN